MNICIFTDNAYIYEGFCALLPRFPEHTFDFFYSPVNRAFSPRENFGPLRLKEQILKDLPVRSVEILPCRGLTSFYAMEKGLIVGY